MALIRFPERLMIMALLATVMVQFGGTGVRVDLERRVRRQMDGLTGQGLSQRITRAWGSPHGNDEACHRFLRLAR